MADDVFHRGQYAQDMATDLLKPSPLKPVASGVFLAGIRRVGKSTFLRQDLIPILQERGALPIYADLWTDTARNPADLVREALKHTVSELESPASPVLTQLRRLKGMDFGAAGLKFGFQLEAVGAKGGVTLADVLFELVQKAKTDVVLIIDEVQQALATEAGVALLHALKAARDKVNLTPGMPGKLVFLGTGSHKSLITDMATRRTQPFSGAITASFNVMGDEFVQWYLERVVQADPKAVLPSHEVAAMGFQDMGSRPEEFAKALELLQTVPAVNGGADKIFPVLCAARAESAATFELNSIEQMGNLGMAIFDRIAAGNNSKVFSAEALGQYSTITGSRVEARHAQSAIEKLLGANLLIRSGHGSYEVSDPFVMNVWRQRQKVRNLLGSAGAATKKTLNLPAVESDESDGPERTKGGKGAKGAKGAKGPK
jgi:hypothetical protein